MALTSYGAAFGSLFYNWQDRPDPSYDPLNQMNGCYHYRSGVTLASITDGLSFTAFASERALSFINANRVMPFGQWTGTEGASIFLYAWRPPNSVFRDWDRPTYKASLMPGSLASSQHPGGVNVLFGDDSVRFVKDSIESWPLDLETSMPVGIVSGYDGYQIVPKPAIWQALFTRSGQEIISADDY